LRGGLLSRRDAPLVVEDAAQNRRRRIGVGVEEGEMTLDRRLKGGALRIEDIERRVESVGQPQVLHPLRVPTRLQEQRSQEDPEQDDAGNPRQGVGGVAHVPSPPNHQPTTQSRAANPPRVPQRPASRERLPRTPHAAATVSMAGKAQVSPCIRAPERSVTTGRSSSPSPPKSTVAPPNTQNGAQSAHR